MKIRSSIRNLPLSYKISGIYILANLIIFLVDFTLLLGINSMSIDMEMTYQENRHLNELLLALDSVQDSMTEYLNSKTTDSLSDYYMSEQNYSEMISRLDTGITERPYGRMERNIRNMSADYLSEVSLTIEAKRGRNVEKYRLHYENASRLYEYVKTYIRSLNEEQFVENSQRYTSLAADFRGLEYIAIGMMFIVLIGSAFVIIRLTGAVIGPLRALAESADEVADGNLEAKLPVSANRDEIGRLTAAFGKMMVSIREYIERLRMSMEKERAMQEKELMMETHLKDAQLKYLQAQINPHFLFNTLNAGAQLAMMEGADRTYEYVQTVADFFRYNVKRLDEPVTIGEEVELVDNYIRILNVRFSGDIHYDKQVDERLLTVKMPGMILQPIVENAVNHGIREMDGKGHIFLRVYRDENRVCISVRDNGKGMSEEDIRKVVGGEWKYRQQTGDSNGIGMDNVIARLRLYEEREDVIGIRSEGSDTGTEVVINLSYERDTKISAEEAEQTR
ncbi:MAG: histidine kinase [Lachnospiraceae bacterium]|nr:histidine kinase [Lachnospiraceae bacterium]